MALHTLPRSSPSAQGIRPESLRAFCEAQRDQEMHALVVLRHGAVVAEATWEPWQPYDPVLVYSLSKTFTSAVIGLCVADGLFGYDDTIAGLLPHLAGAATPTMRGLRVRDCLAMATGHTSDLIEGCLRPQLDDADVARMLATEPDGTVGETFCYNQIATYALSVLVHHVTGRDLHDLLVERILGPLDADPSHWQRDAQGRSLGFTGLQCSVGTLASFFQLVLDGGERDGQQLLAPEWVAQHARTHVRTGDDPGSDWAQGYGWQVWRSRHGHRGDGAFGQFAVMLPEQDMVVVVTGEVADMQVTLDNLWTHLLPGVGDDVQLDDDGDAQLADWLAGRSLAPVGQPWEVPDGEGLLPLRFQHRISDDGDLALLWREQDGTQLSCRVGIGEWATTELVWPEGRMHVAASGVLADGAVHARLCLVNSPHSIHLVTGGDGWARWRLMPLGAPRSPRELCLRGRA